MTLRPPDFPSVAVTDYYLGTLSVTLAASPHLDNLRLVIGLP